MKRSLYFISATGCALLLCVASWATPENLAENATITASGELNNDYCVSHVSDGAIPNAMEHDDSGKAWCLPNDQAEGAEVTFAWKRKVSVEEVVYYGRTAWQWEENFSAYEVYIGNDDKPIKTGALRKGHGPQRIRLTKQVRTKSLRLRFPNHFGGSNPGAFEIEIYADNVPRGFLAPFSRPEVLQKMSAVDYEREGARLPNATPALRDKVVNGVLGFTDVLVIQRYIINSTHVYTYHCEDFRPGGGLYILRPDGSRKELIDAGAGEILDCDLSYDGTEILFSWRKNTADTYQVYLMNLDGSGLIQLTNEPGIYNFNPCWMPDGDIVYLSTRKAAFAYCWNAPVGTLYRMDREGQQQVRLSANYLNDFTPAVLDDGRIVYGRWEYVDRPAIPIQGLWTLHPDGTNLRTYYGNRVLEPGSFLYPHSIPGTGKVLCLLTSHNGPCLGAIGVIDARHGVNAQDSIVNVTPEVSIGRVDADAHCGNHIWAQNQNEPLYTAPYPVDDRYFLVTRAGAVVLRDYEGTEQISLCEPENGMGFYEAKPIMPRPKPPVFPNTLQETTEDIAYIYLRNVYKGLGDAVEPGEVTAIRVVQEMAKPVLVTPDKRAFGFQFPVVSCGATYAPKKVWGEVPVAADGSAAFEVPASKPIYFMALDKEGRAIQRMRSFTHLMPGERQSCIGCHESRHQTAQLTQRPTAFSEPPKKLTPPEWGVRGFSYPRIVQPVFDKHCIECHNPKNPPHGLDLSGDKTEFFNVSYELLVRQHTPAENCDNGGAQHADFRNPYTKWISTYNGSEENILLIEPKYWGSYAGKLTSVIRSGHPDNNGKKRINLSEDERRRIYAWMDLNVPYYGTSDSNNINIKGCRYVEPGVDKVLKEIADRRCASCHERGKVPRRFFTRITNVENDPLLLAPLAKASGGTQACGEAVFQNTDDPDYQVLLAAGREAEEILYATPRIDVGELNKTASNVLQEDGACATPPPAAVYTAKQN